MCENTEPDCYGGCISMHQHDVPVFLPPRERKAKISIWTDINVTDMNTLDSLDNPSLIRCHLVTVFRLDDHDVNPASAALLEMFFHAVQFSRDNCFTQPQTAAFLSILRQVHDSCAETPFDNMESCHCFLRQLVLCHSVLRPPFSVDLFSLEDAQRVVEYVTDTYFRHFKLYKYTFTPDVSMDVAFQYPNIPPAEPVVDGAESSRKEQEQVEKAEPQKGQEEKAEPAEESEDCSALRRLIRLHLTEELGRLKNCADMEMLSAAQEMEEKVEAVEKLSSEADAGLDKSVGKKDKGGKKKKK